MATNLQAVAGSDALIFDAIRTPRGRGKADGALHTIKPIDLVVGLLDALLGRNERLDPARIEDLVLGVVTPIGDQGMDIAKTAAIKAGLPDAVAGIQVNRFCASGLEAVNLAAQKVASGWEELVLAGGVESMSRVPIGSDGGAWAIDPETNYATVVRAAGNQRRPDRDARGLQSRRGRHVRRPLTAAGRGGAGRGSVYALDRAGARPQRAGRARPRRAHSPGDKRRRSPSSARRSQ
jgi:acetyl-CoA acetyltransferase